MTEQVLENLTLELLCDADQDEVALRGSLRLTSELIDSTLLSSDLVVPGMLTDNTPVLVRALRPDCESVGTARILQDAVAVLGDDDVTVRIETTVIPMDLLRSPANDSIEQPIVEIVGRVIAVGSQVQDLKVGDRVCGFAPKELASHISAPRDEFYVVKIDEDADAVALTSLLSNQARASHSSQKLSASGSKLALVHSSKFGNSFARHLERLGYTVTTVTDELESDSTLFIESNAVYSMCPQGLAAAVHRATGGRGFDVVAVPLGEWMETFDLSMVAQGGAVIDLDSMASAIHLPMHISALVRTDFKHLMHDRAGFVDAVRESIALYQQGVIGAEAVLEVSLNDLAWRKLPLGDTSAQIVLTFDTQGNDLPVVQSSSLKFKSDCTYLVTGGFGGFGQKTAEWLIDNGARHLVLTGRTGADNEQRRAFVQKLESAAPVCWQQPAIHRTWIA